MFVITRASFCQLLLICGAGRCYVSATPNRYLAAVAPSAGEGWLAGRATFFDSSQQYLQQFTPGSDGLLGTASAGSCGYFNGDNASTTDPSAVIVPAIMRAGAADGNFDYAGSCGRCYEIQCVSGSVVGNYTADDLPMFLTVAAANPPYTWNFTTAHIPLDDNNDTFPGNSGASENQLTVQCWNETTSVIIQITDDVQCVTYDPTTGDETGVTPLFCTNVTHFQLDYRAFEQLAHPDYGLMNLRFRPVDCDTQQPIPTYFPGFVNTSIVSDRVETGWGLSSWKGATQALQVPNLGDAAGANATCFTIPSKASGLQFICRDCDAPGYQPFLLNNTSGIKLSIKATSPDWTTDGLQTGSDPVPNLYLGLSNASDYPPCIAGGGQVSLQDLEANITASSGKATDGPYGLIELSALFQNPGLQECVPYLGNVTAIYFYTTDAAAVSFCLADMSLLPPMIPSNVAELPPVPSYPNCYYPTPEPTNQMGQLVEVISSDKTGPFQGAVNVSAPKPDEDFVVFEHLDLQDYIDLSVNPLNGQNCTASPTNWTVQLATCARSYNYQCCLKLSSLNNTDTSLAHTLAGICNSILLNNTIVCQAFTWDAAQGLAFFKGQLVNSPISPSHFCNSPNVTTWVLSAALMGQNDTRTLSKKAVGATSHAHSDLTEAWSVGGAVFGILSSVVAVLVWVMLFNSYRVEKKTLLKQIMQHVTARDLCDVPSEDNSLTANPLLMLTAASISSSGALDAPMITAPTSNIMTTRELDDDDHDEEDPAGTHPDDLRKVAKQITLRCLQRWDGFMGLSPSKDSQGRQSGIWRDKFDGVRSASLLLAFRRFNQTLAGTSSVNTGSLFKSWTQSNWKHQGILITSLAKTLQGISSQEAQALPDKDQESAGIQDRLCSCWNTCCQCVRRSG